MKTVREALIDEILYPLPEGKIENKMILRGLDGDAEFTVSVGKSKEYRGCFADCLIVLLQSISFSEADKSISPLSDEMKKKMLVIANNIYKELGEAEVVAEAKPTVYINC